MSERDTIFAVASGAGRAAVTILRLSGGQSGDMLDALCGGKPPPRVASLRRLRDSRDETLDRALVLWFPASRSYTGENCAELHLHGSRAVVSDVAGALVRLGARPAEPGEFTRRAFLNGRMDLVEAEAVADLVAAESSAQRRQALRQLDGALGRLYGGWSQRLTRLMAQQEALIDFPDEDLPGEIEDGIVAGLAALRGEMAAHLNDGHRGERLRGGLTIVVTGPPNVGKSSLINALSGRDVAIVTAVPGTTRDLVETAIDLGGVPATLVDTAGLRETQDEIEIEGIRRARARAAEADLVVAVSTADAPADEIEMGHERQRIVRVRNKIDLVPSVDADALAVSARTGEGLEGLRQRLVQAARDLTEQAGPPPLTRARHRAAVTASVLELDAAIVATLAELRAENMRFALSSLGRVTGRVGVEDLLDEIFGQFCIGK